MMETFVPEITKANVDRFLAGKHVAGCPVCGRYQLSCDVDLRALVAGSVPSTGGVSRVPVAAIAIVCENCGATRFHSRTVIADWLTQQRSVWAKAACERHEGQSAGTVANHRLIPTGYMPAAALAMAFLFVLIAALLFHSYGGAELWTKPTIATIGTEALAALKFSLPTL